MAPVPATWGMLATPFRDDLTVDEASMRSYAEALVQRGCGGVITLGVIAEPATLSLVEKLTSIECALTGGVPVIAGVMSTDAALRRREAAAFGARYGSDLTALMLPILSADAHAVIQDVRDVQESSGLAVSLQDYPAATGMTIDAEALVEVVKATGVELVKSEAQPTFHRISQLKDAVPDLTLMSGLGGLGIIEDLASGATAVAIGITRPEIITKAMDSWSNGHVGAARELVASIGPLINFEIQQHTSIGIRKEHWRRQGVIESAAVRPPAIAYQRAFAPLSRGLGY